MAHPPDKGWEVAKIAGSRVTVTRVTTVPGAASVTGRGLLTGPSRAARVLGVHATCVYLGVGTDVLAVETSDAVGLPCAVRLGVPSGSNPFDRVRRGAPSSVGRHGVTIGALTVQVTRWWAPRRPRSAVSPAGACWLATILAEHPPLLPDSWWTRRPDVTPVAAVRVAPDAMPAHATEVAVDAERWAGLVGWGPGLTPAGDDILAGMLVALHHRPAERDRLAAAVLPHATRRTTALGATLLREAAAGHGVPALLDLADLLADPSLEPTDPVTRVPLDPTDPVTRAPLGPTDPVHRTACFTGEAALTRAVQRLLAVGHTSGTALAWGLLLGAQLPAAAVERAA